MRARARRGLGGAGIHQALQQWQRETSGFTGASLRAGQQITTVQYCGYRLNLDGGGNGVTVLGNGTNNFLGQAEGRKRHEILSNKPNLSPLVKVAPV